MLAGWHQLLTDAAPRPLQVPTRRTLARHLFERSINIDPSNARAWSGLSSVYASQAVTDEISFDEGYERASAAALRAIALDSLEGSVWANLAYMRALETRNLTVGLTLLRRAQAADPSNPELYLIEQNLLTSAHRYERDAARIARQLRPLEAAPVNDLYGPHHRRAKGDPPKTLQRLPRRLETRQLCQRPISRSRSSRCCSLYKRSA